MAVLVAWAGDGLAPGTLTTGSAGTGDNPPGSINGTAPTISSSGPRPPRIIFAADVASYAAWGHAAVTTASWRFYISATTLGTGVQLAVSWNGSAVPWQINVTAAGAFSLDNGAGVPIETSADGAFLAATLHRVEVTYNAGIVSAYLYLGNQTTPLASLSGSITPTVFTEFWWGTVNAGTFGARQADDLIIRDTATLIGPFGSPAPSWDGSKRPLTANMNRLAGTWGLAAQGAANLWAGTNGLFLTGALNAKAGTSGLPLQAVLNQLAGTSGLGVDEASSRIVA